VKSPELFSAGCGSTRASTRTSPTTGCRAVRVPAAGQLEVAQAAARAAYGDDVFLEDVELKLPLSSSPTRPRASSSRSTAMRATFRSRPSATARASSTPRPRAARGRRVPAGTVLACRRPRAGDRAAAGRRVVPRDATAGLELGASFRGIRELWVNGVETLARIELSEKLEGDAHRYLQHRRSSIASFRPRRSEPSPARTPRAAARGCFCPTGSGASRFTNRATAARCGATGER